MVSSSVAERRGRGTADGGGGGKPTYRAWDCPLHHASHGPPPRFAGEDSKSPMLVRGAKRRASKHAPAVGRCIGRVASFEARLRLAPQDEALGRTAPANTEGKAMISADLTGKTVLVTGGSSGIGLAAVELFAKSGAAVAMNHLPEDNRAPEEIARLDGRRAEGGRRPPATSRRRARPSGWSARRSRRSGGSTS